MGLTFVTACVVITSHCNRHAAAAAADVDESEGSVHVYTDSIFDKVSTLRVSFALTAGRAARHCRCQRRCSFINGFIA